MEEDVWQDACWRTRWVRQWLVDEAVPHLCVDKLGGTTGEQNRPCNPGFHHGEIKPQNLWLLKPVGVVAAGETPNLTGEFIGETHRGLKHAHHPTWESAPQGPSVIVGSGESD